MGNVFFNGIYTADYLSDNLSFTYNNSSKLKSITGGILSVILGIIVIILFGYFSQDLVQKRKPESRISQELKPKSEINLLDFPIAVNILYPDGSIVKDAYSYITIYGRLYNLQSINGTSVTSYKTVFFEKCDPDIHFIKYKDIYSDPSIFSPFGSELCLNPNKNVKQVTYNIDGNDINYSDNLSFYNEYGTMNSTFLNIIFYKCNEQRDKKICGSEENFKKMFKNFYVTYYMIDNFIDLQDFENPNKKKLLSFYQQIGNMQPKRNFFRFKKVSINTDDGFLMENNNEVNFFQLDNVKLDFYEFTDNYYQTTFEVMHVNDIFYRRYDKIQDVLAKVGGIFKVLSTVGYMIISYYSNYKFYFDVTNSLFETSIVASGTSYKKINESFDDNNNNNKILGGGQSSSNNNVNNLTNNMPNNCSNNFININNYPPSQKQGRKISLMLSYKDFLKSKVCSSRADYSSEIYSLSSEIIKMKLDILTYMKNIRNIDQLIDFITLNPDEKKIFNCKLELEKKWYKKIELSSLEIDNYNEIKSLIENRLKSI